MATFSENRGLARTFIPKLIEAGYSGRAAERFLKAEGISYKRLDFTGDWREIGGFVKKKDTFKYIRKDYKPDRATITETAEMLSKKYSYVAEVGVQSRITGEVEYHEWRYATDDLVSIAQAEQEIEEETKDPDSPDPEYEYISFHIIGCKKQLTL